MHRFIARRVPHALRPHRYEWEGTDLPLPLSRLLQLLSLFFLSSLWESASALSSTATNLVILERSDGPLYLLLLLSLLLLFCLCFRAKRRTYFPPRSKRPFFHRHKPRCLRSLRRTRAAAGRDPQRTILRAYDHRHHFGKPAGY
jgi:hypothetical protein